MERNEAKKNKPCDKQIIDSTQCLVCIVGYSNENEFVSGR